MRIKETSTKIHSVKYERFLSLLQENKGFEYVLANRFHNKNLIDESGTIHHIAFTEEERLKCAIENVEHYSKMMRSCEISKELESYEIYKNKLDTEKEYVMSIFKDLF